MITSTMQIYRVESAGVENERDRKVEVKKSVNANAINVIAIISSRYKDYKSYFAAINSYASNLPEVGTIVDENVDTSMISMIEDEYETMLSGVYSGYGFDIHECNKYYDGMCMSNIRDFDKDYFKNYGK